jgi:hypothetical protein
MQNEDLSLLSEARLKGKVKMLRPYVKNYYMTKGLSAWLKWWCLHKALSSNPSAIKKKRKKEKKKRKETCVFKRRGLCPFQSYTLSGELWLPISSHNEFSASKPLKV